MITGILDKTKPLVRTNFENKLKMSGTKNVQQYSEELIQKFLDRISATKTSYIPRFEIQLAPKIESGALADKLIPEEDEIILNEKHRLILEKKFKTKQQLSKVEVEFLERIADYMDKKYFHDESKKAKEVQKENKAFIDLINHRLHLLD